MLERSIHRYNPAGLYDALHVASVASGGGKVSRRRGVDIRIFSLKGADI